MNKHVPPARPSRRNLYLVIGLSFVWFAGLTTAAWQRQAITDRWKLYHYQAPASVATLANDDTMTDSARRVFYVNHPLLQPKSAFTACTTGSEQAAVLGCYHSDQNGIFVLDVTDSRLKGIEQVTSAHEMLHAAYDRLSNRDRKQVDTMLLDYYNNDLKDDNVKQQIDGYRKTEPDAVVNEMHSILGTEVPNLPPGLETYYRRYFSDRNKVVTYYQSYENEFINRETQITAADAQLKDLKPQISSLESTVSNQADALTKQQSQLDSQRQSNQIAAYNARVAGFNAAVDQYNSNVDTLKALISQYNDIVQNRNQLAVETQQLASEITTNAASVTEQ